MHFFTGMTNDSVDRSFVPRLDVKKELPILKSRGLYKQMAINKWTDK